MFTIVSASPRYTARMGLDRLFRLIMTGVGMLMLTLVAMPATAQIGFLGTPVPVCIARDSGHDNVAALIRGRGHFDCATAQTRFGAGQFWALSRPMAFSGLARIRVSSLWQNSSVLYALYADGHIAALPLSQRAASRDVQLGAIVEQSAPAHAASIVRLLWHIQGSANLRGILVGATIATPDQSAGANLRLGAVYAGFVGLCIALLVYNAALWGALRHRFQIVYCAMLGCLLVYAFSSSGALAWVWPDIANNDRIRINYISLAMAAAAAMQFARTFFEPRIFAGWPDRATNGICLIMVSSGVAVALLAPWHIGLFDRIYAIAFLAQMAIVIPILWRGWRLRSNYLWMFALGWAAPIGFASLRLVAAFNVSAWNFWVDNSTLISMTLEALLSSVAIAYRIHLLSRERDEAREQEIAARMLADIDPLTGLLNRRAFLSRAIGRPGDQNLLIADIDHFKRVNDTIGHDGGDEVLRIFARTLRQSVPNDALVARFGGEEFAIVVPASRSLAGDDILAGLRAARMPFDLTVTASLGTCSGALLHEKDWKALYRAADRALFDAKRAGRDRVRSALAIPRAAA